MEIQICCALALLTVRLAPDTAVTAAVAASHAQRANSKFVSSDAKADKSIF
jgi:hypothetical protein